MAKFDMELVKEFGFDTKLGFYNFCVGCEIANTVGTIKNRMDLFDNFFENSRKGWWQKGDAYIHRKIFIDTLFGNQNAREFANTIKLYFQKNFNIKFEIQAKPILISKFRQLQETGLEAELFFIQNYKSIFGSGILEDARLFGDGYDF